MRRTCQVASGYAALPACLLCGLEAAAVFAANKVALLL
jgi:hypothetical protein